VGIAVDEMLGTPRVASRVLDRVNLVVGKLHARPREIYTLPLANFQKTGIEKYRKIAAAAGIKPE
jgi:hypothetical protein